MFAAYLAPQYLAHTPLYFDVLLQKLRAAAVGHALGKHLENERTARRGKLSKLQATLAEQQHRMQSFDEREMRRQTMSGTVAQSDLDEDGEDRLKQLFLVRKIYNNMLTRRLRDDQRRTDKLANAYQRIRTATGLDDVNAIVTKFRTREATFASLQAQMKSARDRVDALLAERRALVWALDEARTTGSLDLYVSLVAMFETLVPPPIPNHHPLCSAYSWLLCRRCLPGVSCLVQHGGRLRPQDH